MKLKQLTIHNIASVTDATIHFDQEPLAGSEVFLITGKTGAGKSTILDAICLALYADTPRLYNTNMQGNTADNDKEVKVDDPRQLMRRHTGEAYVELTFTGTNGITYEARWSVARARNKQTGNLQAKKWSLRNTHNDYTYTKDEEIKSEIKKAVGLDFKQFCRTTMLAQGEFTRFLNSKDDEKADILEKITGADVYSRIGIRIYEKTKEKKEEWSLAETNAHNVHLLGEEELDAMKAEIARLGKEQERIKEELEHDANKLLWFSRQQSLQQHLSSTKAALESIEQKIQGDEFRKERNLAAAWRKTQTARGWATELHAAQANLARQEACLKSLQHDYRTLVAMQKALDTDGRQTTARHDALAKELDTERAYVPLYRNAPVIASLLESLAANTQKAKKLQREVSDTEKLIKEKLMPQQTATAEQLVAATKQQEAVATTIATEEQALDAMRLPQLRQQKDEYTALTSNITASREAIKNYVLEAERNRQLRLKLDETAKEVAAKKKQCDALTPQIHDADVACQTLQEAYTKECEQTSDWARRMRAQLHVGDVCPVCLKTIDSTLPHEDVLAQVLAKSEERLLLAQKKRDALLQTKRDTEASIGALEAMLSTQRTSLATTQAALNAKAKVIATINACRLSFYCGLLEVDHEAYNSTIELCDCWQHTGIASAEAESIPTDKELELLLPLLDSTAAEAANTCCGIEQKIKEAEAKEQDIKKLRKRLETLSATCKKHQTMMQDAERQVQKFTGDLRAKQAALATINDEQASACAQVEGLMQDAQNGKGHAGKGWTSNWKSAPSAFATELNDAAQTFGKKEEELKAMEQELQTVHTNLKHTVQTLCGITQAMPQWAETADEDGMLTQWDGLEAFVNRANELLGKLTSANEQARQARLCVEQRESMLADYAREHAQELRDIQVPPTGNTHDSHQPLQMMTDTLDWLNTLTQDDIEAREANLDSTLQKHVRLHALCAEAQKQMHEHTQARPQTGSEDTAESIKSHKEQLDRQTEELVKRKGAICRDMELDKQNRATQGKLQEEARKKKESYAKWDRLNQLFGDATGSKFRKIAQSYVLSSLLHTANGYLGSLTERYSLHVKPGTFVVMLSDAYQGYVSRAASTLSGGESFLVSLALALALSDIGQRLAVDTLFIDEGFGTLSGESLQRAISTLRSLHTKAGKHVGIISHVEELKECIPVQIQVNQEGHNSSSQVLVVG